MHAIGYISFFSFFLSLALLAWFALVVWRLLGNARRKPAQPQCARCAYSTMGVSATRCPECGADLLREGVLTPSMRVRGGGGAFLAIAAWTLTITAITLFLASWVAFATPVSTEFRTTLAAEPVSAQYRRVVIRGDGRAEHRFFGSPFSEQFTDVLIVVTANDGATHELRLTRESPYVPLQLETGEFLDDVAGPFPSDVMQRLLVRAGAAPADQATRLEASELANAIGGNSLWGFGGSFQGGAFTNTTNVTISKAGAGVSDAFFILMPASVCLAGLGVWVTGLVIMVNQHGKRFHARRVSPVPMIAEPYGDPLPESATAQGTTTGTHGSTASRL